MYRGIEPDGPLAQGSRDTRDASGNSIGGMGEREIALKLTRIEREIGVHGFYCKAEI
jgi:hypothetical protein